MNTLEVSRYAAATTIAVFVGLSYAGCGKPPVIPEPPDQLIDDGTWDVVREVRACTTNQLFSTESVEETICPDETGYDTSEFCSATRDGNTVTASCSIPVVSVECSGAMEVDLVFTVTNRRSYTVDGTSTINVEPSSCFQELFPDYGSDGCFRVHEVHTWREPVSAGGCGENVVYEYAEHGHGFSQFVEISAAMHRQFAAYARKAAN